MKKFLITEVEKARILGMHYNAMGKSLVSEQDIPWTEEIINNTGISSIGDLETEYMDMGQFEVTFKTQVGGDKTFAYQCITDPRKKVEGGNFKGDTLRDYYKETIVDPKVAGLKGDWLNYVKKYCKPGYDWLAKWEAKNAPKTQPTPQVAAATTTWSDKAMSDMAKSSKTREEKMVAIQAEAAKVMADTTFLSPEKEKGQLDLDANTVSSILIYSSYLSEEQKMFLKRKISNLLKTKPEYKNEPFSLNINF